MTDTTGATPAQDDKPTTPGKEELHTIKVNKEDIDVPYDELVRRAQLGTASEQLDEKKAAWKQDRANYDAVQEFLDQAAANPAAAKALDSIRQSLLNGTPIPEQFRTAPNQDSGGEGGEPAPLPATDPKMLRIEQTLNEVQARLARDDRQQAASSRRTMVENLIAKDDALRGSTQAADLADSLAAGLMAADAEMSTEDAIAASVHRVRETATDIAAAKHQTRRTLRSEFPTSPGESGTPSLSTGEKNTYKDLQDGTVKKRALAAINRKLFGGS
ncbi:MAG: hypothetical protein GY719_23640 [bacterium]|nr:hypothetical protein [bacterium]